MKVLAFDLATNTGWVAGDGASRPVVGHFRLPQTGNDVGAFLCAARDYFGVLIDRFQPDAIVFEAPILPAQGVKLDTTRKLHGMSGMLEVVCRDRGVPCSEVANSTAKKRLTGSGRAKKPDMLQAARRLGLTIETEDEADALAVWLCAVQHYNPATWPMWEARLKGLELP